MWVIKLGGSLMQSSSLTVWLVTINKYHKEKIIIVPGGGRFADEVRQAQARWRFDEATAHKMAVLAMEQYGLMLGGLSPEWSLVSTEAEMRSSLAEAKVGIWLPCHLLLKDTEIPTSWDMTSDSLGLWLAKLLEAEQYLIIKSGECLGHMELDESIQQGVVDACLAEMRQGYMGGIHLLREGQYNKFHRLVNETRRQ